MNQNFNSLSIKYNVEPEIIQKYLELYPNTIVIEALEYSLLYPFFEFEAICKVMVKNRA